MAQAGIYLLTKVVVLQIIFIQFIKIPIQAVQSLFTNNEANMETFLTIIFLIVIGKVILKIFFPQINHKVNKPFKDIKAGIKGYYEYCKQFW